MRPLPGLGFLLIVWQSSIPACAQDQIVPPKVQGVWAEDGKCSDPARRLVIGGDTVRFATNAPDKVVFEPNDSPSGNGAVHWAEEYIVSNLEYVEGEDALIFNPEGYGTGTPGRYSRCPDAVRHAERRCGWYVDPTPQNLYLVDKHATWWITSQGEAMGPDAEGLDKAPEFDDRQFVETQGGHGYGCACMTVETNPQRERITRIIAGEILPLARCRRDRSLPAPY